jgi:hypothetical protein
MSPNAVLRFSIAWLKSGFSIWGWPVGKIFHATAFAHHLRIVADEIVHDALVCLATEYLEQLGPARRSS